MANELLDFVMALVRDPAMAARYAADPAGTIADAHLVDVTSVDVNNLIPMVSDSLSMAAPAFGVGDPGAGNVWTSGAATAALDAFTPHDANADWPAAVAQPDDSTGVIHPAQPEAPGPGSVDAIIGDSVGESVSGPAGGEFGQFSDIGDGHAAILDPDPGLLDPDAAGGLDAGHPHPGAEHADPPAHPGFDLFD
ncbi:Rv0340 family IniB-related protein [Mycolicibacterium palauense]|uniref:Rv0340 family IniB-related protein n=1 Tax=Mycolicibacterium palauense TaxID=2034511 RepID=UPI000BFEE0AC|nr:IniB N-terminal domain-containing protein [Mycolicibacterium palauense]